MLHFVQESIKLYDIRNEMKIIISYTRTSRSYGVVSVVVSGVGLINAVNRHWARLVLGWVTACGRVNLEVT